MGAAVDELLWRACAHDRDQHLAAVGSSDMQCYVSDSALGTAMVSHYARHKPGGVQAPSTAHRGSARKAGSKVPSTTVGDST